jgi:hypothetical protein
MPRGEENPIYLLEMSHLMVLAIWDILAFRQEIAHNSLGGDPFQILANRSIVPLMIRAET